MSESCVKHPMAVAEFACGRCGHDFCPECVVFPFGLKKPPLCISCALQAGGVSRRETGRPKLSRRSVKQRLKDRNQRTVTRSDIATQGLGTFAERPADPAEEDEAWQEERWMEGDHEAEQYPGGWKQVF